MLVVSRKVSERLLIGKGDDQIVIEICEIKSGRVKIGIEAPKEVPVLRQELTEVAG